MQSLTGKRVLVTGASSGFGRETALLFAAAGASVVATGRTADALATLVRAAPAGAITAVTGDLTDRSFLTDLVGGAGAIDILVNNAGALKHAAFLEADPDDWAQVFEINVLTLLRLTQLVARGMAERRSGHIINISSMIARRVTPKTMVYAASKHAVAAISQSLRLELREFGIRVTEIAPGIAETNVFRSIEDAALLKSFAAPAFQPLTARQVAETILFAAGTDHNGCPELIEIRPASQP